MNSRCLTASQTDFPTVFLSSGMLMLLVPESLCFLILYGSWISMIIIFLCHLTVVSLQKQISAFPALLKLVTNLSISFPHSKICWHPLCTITSHFFRLLKFIIHYHSFTIALEEKRENMNSPIYLTRNFFISLFFSDSLEVCSH